MKHTLRGSTPTRQVSIDYRPVHSYTLTNDVHYIEPESAGITER
jgi:succinate dehydrogenase / fumarate reductase flavoprotein subunit